MRWQPRHPKCPWVPLPRGFLELMIFHKLIYIKDALFFKFERV